MSPKVYAIGSCRVHLPLKLAAERHGLDYLPNRAVEYYHNPAEIRQLVGWLQNGREWMLALAPLLSIVHPVELQEKRDPDRQFFKEADVYIVEISTIKVCIYRGHFLQLTRLRDFLMERVGLTETQLYGIYVQPELARAIKLPVMETDEQWLAQDILATAAFGLLDEAALEAQLRALHPQLGKPVLYVSHFTHLPDGHIVPQRVLIRDVMAQVVPTLPQAAFFDPTAVTARLGYADALADQGHYRPEAERLVAGALTEQLEKLS